MRGHPRSEAVLIKPAEGISYASILHDLKRRVNPDELGLTVQGIRETRSKNLLMELKRPKEGKGRLVSAFQEAIGISGTVRHLIFRIEFEITDLDPSIEREEVEEAVREFCQQGPEMELRISLTDQKCICSTRGGTGHKTTEDGPHQDWVSLLQGP